MDNRYWNEELVLANLASHTHKPWLIDNECIYCNDITPHSKWITSDGSFAHYSCEYCLERENHE